MFICLLNNPICVAVIFVQLINSSVLVNLYDSKITCMLMSTNCVKFHLRVIEVRNQCTHVDNSTLKQTYIYVCYSESLVVYIIHKKYVCVFVGSLPTPGQRVLWVASDLNSIPPGSVLINPQTGKLVRTLFSWQVFYCNSSSIHA